MIAAGGHCFNQGASFFAASPFPVALDNLTLKHNELSNGLGLHAGALFFLSRMPGSAGKFYALTGLSFNRYDAKLLGYTDFLLGEEDGFSNFEYLASRLNQTSAVLERGHWDMERFYDDDPVHLELDRHPKP